MVLCVSAGLSLGKARRVPERLMRLLLLMASACAIGKRTQIKRARRSEAETKALPHCNATDLALGAQQGLHAAKEATRNELRLGENGWF